MFTPPVLERPRKARRSTARRTFGAVIAAAAAHLAVAGLARATPVNFTLTGVTATYGSTTFDFAGSFTFDSSTLSETNVAITATPTSPGLPLVAASYTADDSLCSRPSATFRRAGVARSTKLAKGQRRAQLTRLC
jgi:hypothetical protein